MAQGYIQKIEKRPTKFGDYYDIFIDGRKLGNGKFAPHGYNPGDFVNYEAEAKGDYWNIKAGSLSKADAPVGVTPPALPAPSAITRDKQDVISRQSALNSAIAHVANLVAAGGLPTGTKAPKAGDMVDYVDYITAEYTMRFYHQSTGDTLDLDISAAGNAEDAGVAAPTWEE